MRTVLIATLLALPVLAAQTVVTRAEGAQSVTLSQDQKSAYADAMQAFRDRRFPAAYARFVHLADAGHAPSAQLALMMYTNGPELFGSDWDATPDQQARWNALIVDSARNPYAFLGLEGSD